MALSRSVSCSPPICYPNPLGSIWPLGRNEISSWRQPALGSRNFNPPRASCWPSWITCLQLAASFLRFSNDGRCQFSGTPVTSHPLTLAFLPDLSYSGASAPTLAYPTCSPWRRCRLPAFRVPHRPLLILRAGRSAVCTFVTLLTPELAENLEEEEPVFASC